MDAKPMDILQEANLAQDRGDERRCAIRAAYRVPEPVCVPPLVDEAQLDPSLSAEVQSLAHRLVSKMRAERGHTFGIEALMKEFSLSTPEGMALMCLAELLLRIPDDETRDVLIRDKLSQGDWRAHVGASRSWFVNASAWGLLITGKLVATSSEHGMGASLSRALARGGEPVIRKAMDLAMRLLGRQFVTGKTIEEALEHAKPFEERGFLYSFDMLGEAALTEKDAANYMDSYEHAIHAIGSASDEPGIHESAGISVKLSALHPRYSYTQMDRVKTELYPRLRKLALLSIQQGIGFNIDAEEADRLEPSLDLFEALANDSALGRWQGLGFVVQAYQKRASFVIDYLIDLAERTKRRLMIRLVKGAYWDSEIKRAQVDGLSGYPVYTQKSYTDVCYLGCAKRLLARRDVVFPQFATHNAQTLAAIYHVAGPEFRVGDYEFQCLHGMGETLYGHVVGEKNLNRPCRIYAPVGTHETLLAYLVRRLLENGANTSFVHQLVDERIPIEELIADPVAEARRQGGAPHAQIVLPGDLFAPERKNSKGLDLSDAGARTELERTVADSAGASYQAEPILATPATAGQPWKAICNPANHADIVGRAAAATAMDIEAAMASAAAASPRWANTSAGERAAILERGGDLLEQSMGQLSALLIREAGKSMPNAVSEVREAVDYCWYYAAQARNELSAPHAPLGPTVCISPWNFPLAIFTGQIVAALAAGNPVLAKPAEQTPLIAAEAVRLLHQAGIPRDVLQLVPGRGSVVGAALVADPRTQAVVFTGSTEVARSIQGTLAERGNIPLVAETGGQNAMIVDSSALPEQVVGDVLASAFDSAGQRCSALRVLCLQDAIADPVLDMLKGAMAELKMGDPAHLETDVGPVIDATAQTALNAYVESKRSNILFQTPLTPTSTGGTFVAPTLLRIDSINELTHEVFGPILHVIRFKRDDLPSLIDAINGTGYGLTLGIHSRIDETIDFIVNRARVGNIYVNRNMIGAVVGVQPFGGEGLSGTGPKAGGPLYIHRLLRDGPPPQLEGVRDDQKLEHLAALTKWIERGASGLLSKAEGAQLAETFERYRKDSPLPVEMTLKGPVGEDNRLRFLPRGTVLGIANSIPEALHQFGAALATGNRFLLYDNEAARRVLDGLPKPLRTRIASAAAWETSSFDAVLVSDEARLRQIAQSLARCRGPIIPVLHGNPEYSLEMLVKERTVSINTAAAGGNASLMTLGK